MERLGHQLGVCRVVAASQFSAAITRSGQVYTWGMGDNYRLGHGSEEHVRFPKLVESLTSATGPDDGMVDLAVGQTHVVAVTRQGRLFGWGRNEQGQLGSTGSSQLNSLVSVPTLLPASTASHNNNNNSSSSEKILSPGSEQGFAGVACGPKTTIAWPGLAELSSCSVPLHAPFVVEVSGETFRQLDSLLAGLEVGGGRGGGGNSRSWWPPPRQEEECLACSSLNLLRLQLLAVRQHGVPLEGLGLGPASPLLSSLKKKVVELASSPGVLDTIQAAAQRVLEAAWMILLPTADERARALSALLPTSQQQQQQAGFNNNNLEASASSGRKFMTDLLVSSLMADGGLRAALKAAIRMEIKELEEVAEKDRDKPCYSEEDLLTEQAQLESETKRAAAVSTCWEDDRAANIPLLYLVRQLMKNSAAQSLACLNALLLSPSSTESTTTTFNAAAVLLSANGGTAATADSPSLSLLVKFQRLLMAELYMAGGGGGQEEEEGELVGLLSLLRKYLQHLCSHLLDLLPTATAVAALGQRPFLSAAAVLGQELLGVLLPELAVCLLLLQVEGYRMFYGQILITIDPTGGGES